MEETMKMDYTTTSADALLAALDQAGRTPDRALLEACLDRRDDLVPGLLAWLESGLDEGYEEDWDEDDPRWFREIHAGLLLIAFREEKALPLFASILRDEEHENLWEWFAVPFRNYGLLAVEMLIDLVKDRNAEVWPRIGAAEKLKDIALLHPDVRDRVVEVLRGRLPRVDEDGRFVVPPLDDEDQVELWSWMALALAELKDTDSLPQGKALYDAGLINEQIMGDVKAYLAIFDEDPRSPEPFDLVAYHHPSPETLARREAAREKLEAEMEAPFQALSTDELLHELARAGYAPNPSLIRVCLKRQGALTPGLLDLLARHADATWENDDPRWYGGLHAGRLLSAFREEKALPLVEDILRKDEDEGLALEWFEGELPYYGPAAIPMCTRLLEDASLPSWTRIAGTLMMKAVAQLHPGAKPDVVATLRAALPPLTERGDPDVPGEVAEDQIIVWTFVTLALGRLGDRASQSQVEALQDWDLIDETIYGDYDAYLEILDSEDPSAPSPEFDLALAYAEQYLEHRRFADTQPALEGPMPFDAPSQDDTSSPIGYGGEATFVREEPKVGRNDPCPCGSGKKFKKCCGRR